MKKSYMHKYYIHPISIQPVLIVVVTLNKLLYCLGPLVTYLQIPILMASDVQTHNIALKSKNA